jgi:hypothetical protein
VATTYTNQPAGATIFYDCSLAGTICGMRNVYNTQDYATMLRSDGTTGQVFDSYLGEYIRYGNGQWELYPPRPREIYLGVQWNTNADFQGIANNGNKMFFIKAPSSGDNSFLIWQGLPYTARTLKWDFQAIYSNAHINGWQGDASGLSGWLEPNVNGSAATVAAGAGWRFIEIYLKASTTGTSRDGVVRWWVQRTLCGNYTNVNISPGGFEEFVLTHTWDNGTIFEPPSRDWSKAWHHYFADLRITTGGTVGGGEPPPQVVLESLTPANTSTTVGGTRQFTISMSGAMPSATSLFTTSSNPAVATVPASVTISQGSSTSVFSATGVAVGSTTISTSYNGVNKAGTLQVAAAPTTGTDTTYTYSTDFSGTQGPYWYYMEEDGTEMTYDSGGSVWLGADAAEVQTIWGNGFHPGRFEGSMVRFVVPTSSSARITGAYYDADATGGTGVVARVNHNGVTLFTRTIANGETTGGAYDVTETVAAGDFIDFLVTNQTSDYTYNSTNLNPVIVLTETTSNPGGGTPPDPPATVVDLFTASTTIIKDVPFTLTVRLSKIVTVDTAVEIRVGSTSLITAATSVTVASGTNEKSFTVTPIQVGNVAIDAILTTTARYNASIQPNPNDNPPVEEPEIPPITPENPLIVKSLAVSPDGAVVLLNRPASSLAFRYDAQPEWRVLSTFIPGGETFTHAFTWPSGTTLISYRAQDGAGTWGPHASAAFVPPQPPPIPPPVTLAVTDKDGIRWQLTGKISPMILKRNGSTMNNTYGTTLRRTGDGYMEMLQTNGAWIRRNGSAWEFVA